MGETKLSLELSPGITLGSRALREMRQCGLDSLTVVVRPEDPLLWLYDRKDYRSPLAKYRIVACKEAHLGMSHSIREGLAALLSDEPDAIVVALADQPFITAALLKRLISVFAKNPDADYVAGGMGVSAAAPPAVLGYFSIAGIPRDHRPAYGGMGIYGCGYAGGAGKSEKYLVGAANKSEII
ncbi:NTP transferase domain-containing protein [Paenibacillus sepulcri]